MEGYEVTNIHEDAAKILVDRIRKKHKNAPPIKKSLFNQINIVVI